MSYLDELNRLQQNLPELKLINQEVRASRNEVQQELEDAFKHMHVAVMEYWYGFLNGFTVSDEQLDELQDNCEYYVKYIRYLKIALMPDDEVVINQTHTFEAFFELIQEMYPKE